MQFSFRWLGVVLLPFVGHVLSAEDAVPPDYSRDVAPLLKKYCTGCHNAEDREGKLSLETFADLQRGGERGRSVLPGDADASRLLRVITGESEPKMPPEGNEAPRADEVAVLRAWIEAGAKGPQGAEPDRTVLLVPRIKPADGLAQPVTAVDWSWPGKLIAVARYQTIELVNPKNRKARKQLGPHPGKVNDVEFSADGRRLVAASGIAGLYGQATLWDVEIGKPLRTFKGHRDAIYAAALSPDGKLLATASYDRKVILWDTETGQELRALTGHNGAVYDVAFSPDGTVLASASADETCKLWRVSDGERLDTLSQPTGEQYVVTFSPNGRFVLAGGADNRIRVWRFISKKMRRINPLVHARFGHEGAIVALRFSRDGKKLVSVAEDHTIKLWETGRYTQVSAFPEQPDSVQAAALSPKGDRLLVGRLDGSLDLYPVGEARRQVAQEDHAVTPRLVTSAADMQNATEQEPNDKPQQAMSISLPATIAGKIHATGDRDGDEDLFRFAANQGEQWMIEINAARSKSPLDSHVEVLTSDGQPIERVVLQAVRDSYFTFRGKDSNTSDDFRVFNWQEMELNEYLYSDGEVVKLWLYPRGPDSGFKVYPGAGKRYTYFDTSPAAHALGAPCYIVRPHAPGSTLLPNGLPTFTIYYENDDDSRRRWGADSRMTFTAPANGEYLVRVSDVRGYAGEKFQYKLTVRPRRPNFKVKLEGTNPSISPGSGREFTVRAERLDDYEGPIRVDITGVPEGFSITSPVIIEAGQDVAFGTINAREEAAKPSTDEAKASKVTATAEIAGEPVTRAVNNLGEIKLGGPPKVRAAVVRADSPADYMPPPGETLELTIAPGETIMAKVRIVRDGFNARVSFGKDDSGRNLPHGVYVDNIGLNGLLIVEGRSEREFFLTAAKWAPELTRRFHLKAQVDGNQTTWPVVLHVRK